MLGRKRNTKFTKNSNSFKSKPTEDKILKIKKTNDEEIISESEEGDNIIDNDDFFEQIPQESTDQKRLRLAKKLISKIGTDNKEEIDEYLVTEIKKEKNEIFTEYSSKLSPKQTTFIKGHKNTITCLELNSQYAITGSKDTRAIKWDLETGKKTLLPQFTKKSLLCCAVNNNLAFFAGKDRYVYQIDIHNEKIVNSFKAHNNIITGLIYDSNKDQIFTTSVDTTLKVWALNNKGGLCIETFWGHTDKINDIDMMSGNRLITCGSDNQINLWKTDTQSFLQFKINELGVTDNIKAFNNDNFLSSCDDGSILLWRSNKKKPIFKLTNSHNIKKRLNLNHPFFKNSDEVYSSEFQDVYNPITSLSCIKNSDLIFSGSTNGNINFYKFIPESNDKIQHINSLYLREGSINSIKIKDNQFMIAANGRDSRLGRWDVIENAKNGISIIKLFD